MNHHLDCLFYCCLSFEKYLKAKVVKVTYNHSQRIHNFSRLAELANIELTEVEKDFIEEMNKRELRKLLWRETRDIDLRIEPIGYTIDSFVDEVPLVWEVKQHGY